MNIPIPEYPKVIISINPLYCPTYWPLGPAYLWESFREIYLQKRRVQCYRRY